MKPDTHLGRVCLILLAMAPTALWAQIHDGLGGVGAKPPPAKQMSPHRTAPVNPAMTQDREPAQPAQDGVLLSMTTGSGYSYMELDQQGKTVWLAASPVAATKGDRIRFVPSIEMRDFYSKFMKRSFDHIIFAEQVFVNP